MGCLSDSNKIETTKEVCNDVFCYFFVELCVKLRVVVLMLPFLSTSKHANILQPLMKNSTK